MSPSPPTGSAPTVYLHIGTLKSGTSFLQGVLWFHRELLAEDGVLYPGVERWSEQVDAVRDVLNEERRARSHIEVGAWESMCGRILAWPGRSAIMSMELLSLATPDRVERIVASLRPAEVHAVITARDLARVIPSSWQETVQNRQTWSWEQYVEGLTGSDQDNSLPAHRFWRQQDVPRIARSWADVIGADRLHLVVVPRTGAPRDELWRRFAPVVGLDPDAFVAPGHIRGNPAMGAASAEFVRRLNLRLGKGFDFKTYERSVKQYLSKNTLVHRADEERLRLPEQYETWATARATEIIGQLRELDIDVRGDLDELLPEPAAGGQPPLTLDESEVAAAGVQAVEALVRSLAEPSADAEPVSGGGRQVGEDQQQARRQARRRARRAAGGSGQNPRRA